MARPKSEFLKAFGKSFEVFKAITDEVLDRGGTDEDIERILKEKDLRVKLADLIVVRPKVKTFTFEVDFDDPRWDRIDQGPRRFVGDITARDYPRKFRGKKRVTCMLQPFDHDWQDQEAIDAAKTRNGWTADRAITETFGEKFPNEQLEAPVIGICGDPVQRHGELLTPYVDLYSGGVRLGWDWTGDRWSRLCRALAVLTVEDL